MHKFKIKDQNGKGDQLQGSHFNSLPQIRLKPMELPTEFLFW